MTIESIKRSLAGFRKSLPSRAQIYVAGCSGEPTLVAQAFKSAPDLAEATTFCGIWIPGVNHTDWAGLSDTSEAKSIFVSPSLRRSFEAGRTHFLPLSYTQSTAWLASAALDGGIVMTTPPDVNGMVSLGVSADFSDLILTRATIPILGVINHAMKAPLNGLKVPLSRFASTVEIDHPLVEVEEADLPDSFEQIGRYIAELCSDGDTLQFGLGNVQQSALKALRDHKHLRIHAGMISTPLIDLLDRDALSEDYGAITTGVAIGTQALYNRVVHEDRIVFAPVSYTHAVSTLSALPNFKAINSCIEVDLFGQANAEFINGRQVSGTGGLVDFLRGAREAENGRGIVALASSAKNGTISRIVPRLPRDATSIARADIDTVVTEHGIAVLKHKTIEQRAKALIEIAHPKFRDDLAAQWSEIRKSL